MSRYPFSISASIVCGNMANIAADIKALEQSKVEYIHFDVMDGVFVPRLGLLPEMLTAIGSLTKIPVDVHLMVCDPLPYIEPFCKAGADLVSVHAESTPHLDRAIRMIKANGVKAGVALNPATPLHVLDYLYVVLMAINPGIVGHKLIPSMMNKISDLKKKLAKNPDIIIEIDGGVSFESASEMVRRGASMLVCGSSTIFRSGEKVEARVTALRKKISADLKK